MEEMGRINATYHLLGVTLLESEVELGTATSLHDWNC
jgi:hypothetical protein